jgi:hypothetical protein
LDNYFSMAKPSVAPWDFSLPHEANEWLKSVFAEVNHRTSAKLTRIPTTHETSLDLTVIEQLSQFASPFRFSGNWLVRLDTHYLGGGRHFGSWEIADLGILVIFRRGGVVERVKVALMQSKRLYPDESMSKSEDLEIDYHVGFTRLLHSESEFKAAVRERTFHFSSSSQYRAPEYKGEQYRRAIQYQKDEGIPVHYCFYNPPEMPTAATLPISAPEATPAECRVGCRIIPSHSLDNALQSARRSEGYNPSYSDLQAIELEHPTPNSAGWSLENFIVDLVIGCHEGYVAGNGNPTRDRGLFRVFGGRTAPISAALSITIDAPAL